jgi:hypothetical protein
MITPTEIGRKRYVTLIGWGVADRLFGPEDPLDKKIKVAGVPFTVVGVSKKKGAAFGQSLDEFVVIPLGVYQKLFGARQSLQLMVKPRDAAYAQMARDEARVALRVDRGLKPTEPTTSAPPRLDDGAVPAGHGGHRRGADDRGAFARGRRHRDHEHHAHGGQRAHERDRPEEGARRETSRHHVADPDRVDHAVDRRHRHRPRCAVLTIISALTPVPSSVESWSVLRCAHYRAVIVFRLIWRAARRCSIRLKVAAGWRGQFHETGGAARQGAIAFDTIRAKDALGADGARRRDRRHLDRRHDVAHPRLRHLPA